MLCRRGFIQLLLRVVLRLNEGVAWIVLMTV